MSLVIVGSGLAGYLLLKELRDNGYDKKILMYTKDDGDFYSKPQISTALTQNKTASDLVTISAAAMQKQYDFTLFPNATVSEILPAKRQLLIGDQLIPYTDLVLATGSIPCKSAWNDIAYKINSLADYKLFRDKLVQDKVIAIVGAGLVGCELAADLALSGYKVHLISEQETPIANLLPVACGQFLLNKLQQAGVIWHVQPKITRNLAGVMINDEFFADLLISAIGLTPNTALAVTADLTIDNGIVVDGYCQTSNPNIYALGDCANVNGQNLTYVAPIRQCVTVMTKKLLQQDTAAVNYPIMPVILKTPMCRTLIIGASHAHANWQISTLDDGVVAKQFVADRLCGFVLMGDAVKLRAELTKELSEQGVK